MPRISEEAVRRIQEHLSGQGFMLLGSPSYDAAEKREARGHIRDAIQDALPAILSDLRRELLGDEAVQAAADWTHANFDEAKECIEAAIGATSEPKDEPPLDSIADHRGDPSDA